ncbi:MAG: hypothetical protein JWN85_661, partial [Gammaproteobacteria bacterium]|nr:hypothetical protein [Gammaproteobacteria bacterium]
ILAVTAAGRYDRFSDFGGKATPQFGVEWRPLESLLVRGAYNRTFKAPSLDSLYEPQTPTPQLVVYDPMRGNQASTVTAVFGGNPNLRPETGVSKTFGLVYAPRDVSGLQLGISHWSVDESDNIQSLRDQDLVDNEALFPGHIIRADSCAGGPPCPIVTVYPTYENFGHISVAGLDYQASYKYHAAFGEWTPSASATQTYHFLEALTPRSPAVDAVSNAQNTNVWAPRWKATTALGWKLGPYSASADGRYVGRYRDYGSPREIGNFWLFDANFRYAVGAASGHAQRLLGGLFIEIGGVNLFNTLPQYSNYKRGLLGYDPAESDIRGRFVYVNLGTAIK